MTPATLLGALAYVEREFVIDAGINGEMWAEGLAFGVPHPTPLSRKAVELAAFYLEQLPPAAWSQVLARADYLRRVS